MGKFSRNREYEFENFEDVISNIITEFEDGNNVSITLTWEETGKYIKALLSTSKFTPYSIEFGYPEINGYNMEYCISLSHLDGDTLWCEPSYDKDYEDYLSCCSDSIDVMFVSDNVSKKCYDKLINDGLNTVLFSTKE